MIALLKYLADPYNQLPAITFWLLGSLAAITPRDLAAAAPARARGPRADAAPALAHERAALPDDEARALGVDTRKLRTLIVAAATLMTAAAVAVSGIIGWVGLVVRVRGAAPGRPELPAPSARGAILGGGYLLLVDTLAAPSPRSRSRSASSPP